jgi:hypothetical protein
MTSNVVDGALYSLLDHSPLDSGPGGATRAHDWETHALERVSAHVRELVGQADGNGGRTRNWESQAVERLARYLRTGAR